MNKVKITYNSPKTRDRVFSFLIDILIFFITSLIIFLGAFLITERLDIYRNNINKINEIRIDSGLYINVNNELLTYDEYLKTLDLSLSEENTLLNDKLNEFYLSIDKIDVYNELKLNETYNDLHLFILNDNEVEINVSAGILPSIYNDFYIKTLNSNAIGYLLESEEYLESSRFILISILINILISTFISYLIYYFIIPISSLNKSTIGMKLFKIGYINFNGLSIKNTKYILISIFNYFIMYILSFIGLFIPSIISFSFFLFNKERKTLTDYIFNVYKVDIENKRIYKTSGEYIKEMSKYDSKFLSEDSILLSKDE